MGENKPNYKKCFNAPKNWQLGWFKDRHVNLDIDDSMTVDLVGVVDYDNLDSTSDHKLFVRIKGGIDEDIYVSFNRQRGANQDTEEGGDKVLIHTRPNDELVSSQSKSTLRSKLNPGQSTTRGNHIISVTRTRTLDNNIREARVQITASSLSPSKQPSNFPSKSRPPTQLPSAFPTTSIHPSNYPSMYPSAVPSLEPSVSEAPSKLPTITPTTSIKPSLPPSLEPSLSESPSFNPTSLPSLSIAPSMHPNSTPRPSESSKPSTVPSTLPTTSEKPSTEVQIPSNSPTQTPSKFVPAPQQTGPCNDTPRTLTGIPGILLETTCKKFVNQFSEAEIADMCLYTVKTGPKQKCPGVCDGNCRCRDRKLVKFEKAKKRMACQALSRKKLRKRNKICKRNDDARDKCTVSTVSIYFNNVEIFFHFAIRV